jgi:hypothetical protein
MRLVGFIDQLKVVINDGVDVKVLDPKRSQAVINHSPDGFAWGYAGSGPAQLALAILLEVTDEKTATSLYQKFKTDYIAILEQRDFDIFIDVEKWLNENGGKFNRPSVKQFCHSDVNLSLNEQYMKGAKWGYSEGFKAALKSLNDMLPIIESGLNGD